MRMQELTASGARSTAFALVSSLAAFVVAATGLSDLLGGSVNLSTAWTCVVIAVALSLTAMPLALGERFHPAVALGGCWFFAAVTALQVASGGDTIMTVNNIVLYPMVSCYLGWFFVTRVARATVVACFVLSGIALVTSDQLSVFSTWVNLALASFFCLEAALYLRAKLEQQIQSDPLTGALNRNGLSTQLARELPRAARANAPMVVAAIDLDGFKAINDRLGHAAGDQTLVAMVADIRRSLRPHDSIARTGGDEFVVLLPDTSQSSAVEIMSRLQRSSVAAWTFGIASSRPSDTQDSLLQRADEVLYLQKKGASHAPPE